MMKVFFGIKWELILTILFGISAVVGYFLLTDDTLGCIMEVILVFAFTSMIVEYKTIRDARRLVKENL